jgi:hypothetical protein
LPSGPNADRMLSFEPTIRILSSDTMIASTRLKCTPSGPPVAPGIAAMSRLPLGEDRHRTHTHNQSEPEQDQVFLHSHLPPVSRGLVALHGKRGQSLAASGEHFDHALSIQRDRPVAVRFICAHPTCRHQGSGQLTRPRPSNLMLAPGEVEASARSKILREKILSGRGCVLLLCSRRKVESNEGPYRDTCLARFKRRCRSRVPDVLNGRRLH